MRDTSPHNIKEAIAARQQLVAEVRTEKAKLSGAKLQEFEGKEAWLADQGAKVQSIESRLRNLNQWIKGRNEALSRAAYEGAKKRRSAIVKAIDTDYVGDLLVALLQVVERMARQCSPTPDEAVLIAHARDVAKVEEGEDEVTSLFARREQRA